MILIIIEFDCVLKVKEHIYSTILPTRVESVSPVCKCNIDYVPLLFIIAFSFESDQFASAVFNDLPPDHYDDPSSTLAGPSLLFLSSPMRHRSRYRRITRQALSAVLLIFPWKRTRYSVPDCDKGGAAVIMDPSILATMDKDALKKQIENMKYQASMERWPLSKSIAA